VKAESERERLAAVMSLPVWFVCLPDRKITKKLMGIISRNTENRYTTDEKTDSNLGRLELN